MAMMKTNVPASMADQFQAVFSKKLLDGVKETLVLNTYGQKYDLPTNTGNNSITMFQWDTEADASNVQSLTEGTTISTYRDIGLRKINVPLAQVGEALKLSDILNYTQLFNALQEGIRALTLDAAQHLDTVVRNALHGGSTAQGVTVDSARGTGIHGTTIPKIYAGASTTAAGLVAAADGYLAPSDLLDAATAIRNEKNVSLNETFTAIVDPSVAADLLKDQTVLNIAYRNVSSKVSDIAKGQIGDLYGVSVSQHTNAFKASSGSENTYATSAASGEVLVYSTYVMTSGAFGTVNYSGQSPYAPSVVIVDKPDKSDILNQNIYAGWKAHWAVQVLNAKKARILCSKSRTSNS